MEVADGDHGGQGGSPQLHEKHQEEHHVQILGGILGDPDERSAPPPPLVLEVEGSDPAHPRDGRLRRSQQPREDDQAEHHGDLGPVQRAEGSDHGSSWRRTPE